MKKKVKARKEHKCVCCGDILNAGDTCWYEEGRDPVIEISEVDPNFVETQVGILYWKAWHCLEEEDCNERMEERDGTPAPF